MTRHPLTWLSVLSILAACDDNAQSSAADEDETTIQNRTGVYDYVLGVDEDGNPIVGGSHKVTSFDDDGKREAIDSANRPQRLHPDLGNAIHQTFDGTLTEGSTDWPVFASTWWPQSRNGTAWRWQPGASSDYGNLSDRDRLSPLEKYDLMFNPGQTTQVAAVSHCEYRDAVDDPENCTRIDHPAVTVAGPATAWEMTHQGQYQQYEPESWWGHCNGWASYATTESLGFPQRDIRVRFVGGRVEECTNGDTNGCMLWRMADIEGLMTEVYFSDEATFSGRRCNTSPDEIERDDQGRPVDVACRDLNPGAFHTSLVGLLGRGARSLVPGSTHERPAFVIDHNWDWEVWNFPVVRYQINEQESVDQARATALVGAGGSTYTWNTQATRFQRIKLTYWMVSDGVGASELTRRADLRSVHPVPVELNYVLELNDSNTILGGEWIDDPTVSWGEDSKRLHPDFMWMAIDHRGSGENADDLGGSSDNPHISYARARALLACANEPGTCAPTGGGGGGGGGGGLLNETDAVDQGGAQNYSVGPVAPGSYRVTLSHDPARPGGDADLHVRLGTAPTVSQYDCRPYLDGSDEVCDVNVTSSATIYIMVTGYDAGSNAYRLTVTGTGGGSGGGGTTWTGMHESGALSQAQEVRFETAVLPAGTYRFAMTGTGDADLHVRRGAAATTTAYDCRPYATNSNETCDVVLPTAQAIHVMIRGYGSSSTFDLVGSQQ